MFYIFIFIHFLVLSFYHFAFLYLYRFFLLLFLFHLIIKKNLGSLLFQLMFILFKGLYGFSYSIKNWLWLLWF